MFKVIGPSVSGRARGWTRTIPRLNTLNMAIKWGNGQQRKDFDVILHQQSLAISRNRYASRFYAAS